MPTGVTKEPHSQVVEEEPVWRAYKKGFLKSKDSNEGDSQG